MKSEKHETSEKSVVDRHIFFWQKDENGCKSDFKLKEPTPEVSRPQKRHDRPLSQRGTQNEVPRVGSALRVSALRSDLVRPPSASVHSQRGITAASRINVMPSAMGICRINTEPPSTSQVTSSVLERPITQHGVAGIQPGTTRGLPMTRQIQDKRYYEGLIQLKIRELNQEITIITKQIDSQNKEHATFMHYNNRAKELAAELTELQGRLADYNIIIDKIASNVDKDMIEQEIKEMNITNDRASMEIVRLFEQRRLKDHLLKDMERKIESEQKKAEQIIESMDPSIRESYNKLITERDQLENKMGRIQKDIDLLLAEKLNLGEQISLSPIKQEAVKLRMKIFEVETKRERLQEQQRNKLSPDEERELLLIRVKQDNMDTVAAEKRIVKTNKKISEAEQELEQLDADLEENHSSKQIKYNELRKREEAIDQFLPTYENNKDEELKKLGNLEESVVQKLQKLAYAINQYNLMSIGDEMAILNMLNENSNHIDQSFEGLSKEHIRLQQTVIKIESLKKKLNSELIELKEKITQQQNELIVLEDLESLKSTLELKQKELMAQQKNLKAQQANCNKELTTLHKKYETFKCELEKNEMYVKINVLEEKLHELKINNKPIEDFISISRDKMNYQPLRNRALELIRKYNVLLCDTFKPI